MAQDILIIDDEADIRLLIAGILEDEGYTTREAGTVDAGLAVIRQRKPGLIILDIWLEGSSMDGMDLLKLIKSDYPEVPVLMISGHGNIETAVTAIKHGAYDFIEKPFKADKLLVLVERAMETARLKRENADLKKYTSVGQGLIGVSSGIAALRQIIEKVAPTGSRVLISGPPGAGKEVVAREIHAKSPRQKAPFVVVNCASMHPDRMERELFGVENPDEDGARKVGMFEQAHGGTLLLDEVADMPLETQGKIVRVLQDQQFERIGGVTPVTVDVRVVATTNRNLQDGISKGEFREDLYYRLNVVPIQVPALKERRQDIKALIAYFLEKAAASSGAPLRQLSDDALVMLESYDWPGNVRQLRNIIDWLMIMATGPANAPITAESLPAEITSSDQMSQSFGPTGEIMTIPLRDARELFEKQYLQAQLTRFEGNISKTAEFVGMERSALHRKLKSLGVGTDQKGNG